MSPFQMISTTSMHKSICYHNIHISNSLASFLKSYSLQPINVTFSSFQHFTETVFSIERYDESHYIDSERYTTTFDVPQTDFLLSLRLCSFISITSNAIYTTYGIRLYSCYFTLCGGSTVDNGGGVFAQLTNSSHRILVNSCDFVHCSSNNYGGSVYVRNGQLEIFRTHFISSRSAEGGAIFYDQANNLDTFFIISCMFHDCTANLPSLGPIFYAIMNTNNEEGPQINIHHCRFTLPDGDRLQTLWFIQNYPDPTIRWQISEFRNRFSTAIEDVHMPPTSTFTPSPSQTPMPTATPTATPTESPTASPLPTPTQSPTESPSMSPTESPTETPTETPTMSVPSIPTLEPPSIPTESPTESPTETPTESLTESPTQSPTEQLTPLPTESPTMSLLPTSTPMPTETPYPTASPVPVEPAWESMRMGLLIFFGILLIIGIIANIILCLLCCRTHDLFAKQYV